MHRHRCQRVIGGPRRKMRSLGSEIGVDCDWLVPLLCMKRPDALIGSMGSGAMRFGVAGAPGAKLVAPHRPIVSVSGDATFLMYASVLPTAVEYAIPVVLMVWNDGAHAATGGRCEPAMEG